MLNRWYINQVEESNAVYDSNAQDKDEDKRMTMSQLNLYPVLKVTWQHLSVWLCIE